jgi:hypothetical protein
MTVSVPALFSADLFEALQGEPVLWGTRPQRWAYARARVANAVFFAAIAGFLSFVVLTHPDVSAAHHDSGSEGADLFFLPLFLLALADLFYTLWKSQRVYYAVGERHGVIIERGVHLRVRRFDLQNLAYFEVKQSWRNRGDIVLEKFPRRGKSGQYFVHDGFMGLPDLAAAKAAFARAKAGLRGASAPISFAK